MAASDAFSEYYTELLQGTYDCVDRIVLNAFFPFGQTGGGIRSWWRWLRGDDLIQREFPRLCRGGSQSLTDPGVYAVGTRTRNGRMSDLTLPLCAWFASPASLNFGVAFKRLRKGPFEGPATVKPPALPEDIYLRSLR